MLRPLSRLGQTSLQFPIAAGYCSLACAFGIALDESDGRLCTGCSLPMGPVGDHALCCCKLGVYARHNDLRDAFGPDQPAISDRGWVLSACMRIGVALDESDRRFCSGCSLPMDPV